MRRAAIGELKRKFRFTDFRRLLQTRAAKRCIAYSHRLTTRPPSSPTGTNLQSCNIRWVGVRRPDNRRGLRSGSYRDCQDVLDDIAFASQYSSLENGEQLQNTISMAVGALDAALSSLKIVRGYDIHPQLFFIGVRPWLIWPKQRVKEWKQSRAAGGQPRLDQLAKDVKEFSMRLQNPSERQRAISEEALRRLEQCTLERVHECGVESIDTALYQVP